MGIQSSLLDSHTVQTKCTHLLVLNCKCASGIYALEKGNSYSVRKYTKNDYIGWKCKQCIFILTYYEPKYIISSKLRKACTADALLPSIKCVLISLLMRGKDV